MNMNKFKQMQNTSDSEFKVKQTEYDKNAIQIQKINHLRLNPEAKQKHTINGLKNETLADFLELCMLEEKSQTAMLGELIATFKN